MIEPVFRGKIESGKLILENQDLYEQYLSSLTGDVIMTVTKPKKDRSNKQNRYYRGVVVKMLSDQLGYEAEEIHSILGQMFLLVDGPYPFVRSTKDLTTVEMEEFLARVRRWASVEHGMYIPNPNECVVPNYY